MTIDGLDVTRTAGDVLARRLSILRQDNPLGSRLTVQDLVLVGRYPHSRGRPTPSTYAGRWPCSSSSRRPAASSTSRSTTST